MMAMMIMTMVVMAGKQTVDMRKDIRAHGQADMQIGRQAGRRTGRHTETHRQTSRQLSYVCLNAVQADRRAVGRQPVMPSVSRPADRQAGVKQTGQGENMHAGKHTDRQACIVCMIAGVYVCMFVRRPDGTAGGQGWERKCNNEIEYEPNRCEP